jgi:hypothetical protein
MLRARRASPTARARGSWRLTLHKKVGIFACDDAASRDPWPDLPRRARAHARARAPEGGIRQGAHAMVAVIAANAPCVLAAT